jgi:hypothetical protein
VFAPEEWGWPGYLYSGYDWQWAGNNSNWNPANFPDRAANGGLDFGPWLLQQLQQYELTNGTRLLDVFTLHIYPQGANESGSDTSLATQLGRNRSTRALWDPSYVDNSWINSVIKLIPRMREWVTNYYPGTKIGITEYNWGAEDHINGATAQADLLGIFGREGLDVATRWTTPAATSPSFQAMKMYRNYDGNKSTFGETSVAASGPESRPRLLFRCRAPRRRRPHHHGDQQATQHQRHRDDYAYQLPADWRRASLATDLRQHHHVVALTELHRQQLHQPIARAEHHALCAARRSAAAVEQRVRQCRAVSIPAQRSGRSTVRHSWQHATW